jgi:4-amino-4-deoxy-L-arabinose transferase-like glycosyltransferase
MLRNRVSSWIIFCAAGAFLRVWLAYTIPFTVDEGAYLYDARTLLEGRLPGGDGVVKAPVTLVVFALSELLSNRSLYAARAVSVIAGLFTAFPLFSLGQSLFSKRAGWIAAALWLVSGPPALLGNFGTTESLAALCGSAALALLARSHSTLFFDVAAGTLLGAGFGSRKTALMLLPVAFLLCRRGGDARLRLFRVAGGMGSMLVLLASGLGLLYGPRGATEFLGFGTAAIFRARVADPAILGVWTIGMPHLDGVLATVRVALPLVCAAVLGSVVFFSYSLGSRSIRVFPPLAGTFLFGALGILLTLHPAGMSHRDLSVTIVLAVSACFCALFAVRSVHVSNAAPQVPQHFWLLLLWLGALAAGYASWPVFLPEYALDFLPVAVLIGAVGSTLLYRQSHRLSIALFILLAGAAASSLSSWFRHPASGAFTISAVRQAAQLLKTHVPLAEPVFTGAVIVPAVSGHHVTFDIAHPLWYRYAFVSDASLSLFLPPLPAVEDVMRKRVQWVLLDQTTDYAYLRQPSDLLSVLKNDFHVVAEVPNNTRFRNNPLSLWKRVEEKAAR